MPKKRKTSETRETRKVGRYKALSPEPDELLTEPVYGPSFAVLNRPNARWRELGAKIHFDLILEPDLVQTVRRLVYEVFFDVLQEAGVSEERRVRERLEQMKINGSGTPPRRRPTDRALKTLMARGESCNQGINFGHVPGIDIGDAFQYKVQMRLIGLHRLVMAGIDYASVPFKNSKTQPLAISIVVAGGYADDEDHQSEMLYTGQGGNDLLGRRVQVCDQKLVRGNLALFHNAVYGVPVRVIKKNGDKFIYDGLWDVLQMIKRRGIEGYVVYQYRLKRCPGQKASDARKVMFKEGQSAKTDQTVRTFVTDEICEDFSRGRNPVPISVANDIDSELPPGLTISDLREDVQDLKNWIVSNDDFEFGLEMRMTDKSPAVTDVPSVPKELKNAPHEYLRILNHGVLPYQAKGTLHHALSILYECGPWLGCRSGKHCSQCVTTKPPRWKLQIFKTADRGWGVKTLELIPIGSFVMKYVGEMVRVQDVPSDETDIFSFGMTKRPDYTDENIWLAIPQTVEAEYEVTGRRYGNVFRFINHSCNPNCFTQPVLSEHLDRSRPDINIFAMRTIFPGEEISYDYGRDYLEKLLNNDCKCGAACCIQRDVEIES